jgi:hypothetical protein
MPRPYRLPNGSVINISDDPAQRQLQYRAIHVTYGLNPDQFIAGFDVPQPTPYGYEVQQPITNPLVAPEEEQPDISLTDSRRFMSGIEQGFHGILDIPASAMTAIASVLTPGGDTKLERDLRRAEEIYMAASDPEAASLYTSQLSRGLGQAAGLTALAFVPAVGAPLAIGGGVALGIAEAARRLRAFEESTGTDVPWYKETAAHGAGSVLGLAESMLPARLASRIRATGQAKKSFSQIAGESLGGAAVEGLQEGLAQVGQAAAARGLYDRNAFDNIFYSASQDAKVGAGVGLITSAVVASLGGRMRSSGSSADLLADREIEQQARVRDSRDMFAEAFVPEFGQMAINNGLSAEQANALVRTLTEGPTGYNTHFLASSRTLDEGSLSRLIREMSSNAEQTASNLEQEGKSNEAAFVRQYEGRRIQALQNRRTGLRENFLVNDLVYDEAMPTYEAADNDFYADSRLAVQNSNTGQAIAALDLLANLGIVAPVRNSDGVLVEQTLSGRNMYSAGEVGSIVDFSLDKNLSTALQKFEEEIQDAANNYNNVQKDRSLEDLNDPEVQRVISKVRDKSHYVRETGKLAQDVIRIENLNSFLESNFNDEARIESAAERVGVSVEEYSTWLKNFMEKVRERAEVIGNRREALQRVISQIGDVDPAEAMDAIRENYRLAERERVFTPIDMLKLQAFDQRTSPALNDGMVAKAHAALSATLADAETPMWHAGGNASNTKLAETIKSFLENKRTPIEEDVENILSAKNLKLRDQNIAVGSVATGVNSPAFKKLVQSLSGAKDWKSASDGQKWLVYARLAQMTPNYGFVRRGRFFSRGSFNAYPAAYLSDFMDGYDPVTGEIVDNSDLYDAIMRSGPQNERRNLAQFARNIRNMEGVHWSDNEARVEEAFTRLAEAGYIELDGDNVELTTPEKRTASVEEFDAEGLSTEPFVDEQKTKEALSGRDDLITILRSAHNERNPDNTIDSNEDFVDTYWQEIARYVVVKDLTPESQEQVDREFINSVVQGNIERIKQSLDSQGNLGNDVIGDLQYALRYAQAIPVDASNFIQLQKQQHYDSVQEMVKGIKEVFQRQINNLGLGGQIELQLVSEIDDWAAVVSYVDSISDLSIVNKDAVYNSATGRFILNLSRLDPERVLKGDEKSMLAIIHEAANDVGLNTIVSQHLSDAHQRLLSNYARRATVPESTNTYGLDSPTYRVLVEKENEGKGLLGPTLDRLAAARVLMDASAGVIKRPDSIAAPVRIARNFYRDLSGAVMTEPDILDVFRVFDQINSGAVADRGMRPDVAKNFVEDSEYLRFATGDQLNELRKLHKELGIEGLSPSLESETNDKIEKVLDEILEQRREMLDQAPPDLDLSQAIQLRNEQIAAFRDEAPTNVPVLGPPKDLLGRGKEGVENRAAADEAAKVLDGRPLYEMPTGYKNILLQQHRISARTKRIVEDAKRRRIVPPENNSLVGEEYLDKNNLGIARDELIENLSSHKYREKHLDRTIPLQLLDQYLAGRSEAGPLMERQRASSLAYIASIRDNIRGYSSGMFNIGSMAYIDGQFGSTPFYDEKLGRYVGGFKDLVKLVNTPDDQKAAYLYGIAKQIKSYERKIEGLNKTIEDLQKRGVSEAVISPFIRDRDKAKISLDAAKQVRVTDNKGKTVTSNFGNTGFIDDIISSIESDDTNAHIVEFWDLYQAMNRGYLTLARDTGLISDENLRVLKDLEYIPYYEGLLEEQDEDGNPLSAIVNSRALSGLTMLDVTRTGGSQVNAHELLANLNSNMQSLVAQSVQNVLAKRAAEDLLSMNMVEESATLGKDAPEGQYLIFKDKGVRRVVKLSDEDAQTDLSQIVRAVMTAQVNPAKVVKDLFGGFLPPSVAKFAADATFGTSDLLRETVTRMPAFPVRNLFRDSLSASTTLGDPGIFLESIRNAFDPATSVQAERLGIKQPVDMVTSNPDYYRSQINLNKGRDTLEGMGIQGKSLLNPLNATKAVWNTLGRITDNAEAATRMAVYRRVLAKTGDHAAAIEQALDVLNYGKRGTSQPARVLLATIPFASGRVQGLDVTYRALRPFDRFRKIKGRETGVRRPGAQRFGVTESEYAAKPLLEKQKEAYIFGLMTLAALSGMYELFMRFNDEDDEYAGLDERLRRENYLIPWSKHVWLRLPVPFEVGLLTKTIPQIIGESIFLENYDAKDAVVGTADAVQRTLSLGSPQVVSPFFDLWLNKDSFFKGEIVPELTQQLSPRYQYTTGTSDVARLIARAAEKTGLGAASKLLPGDYSLSSPMVMEYLLTKYFGTMGLYAITTTDALMRNEQLPFYDVADKAINVRSRVGSRADFARLEAMLGGDGVTRMPVMSSLLTDPRGKQGVVNQFYELQQQLNAAVRDLGAAKDEAGTVDEYVRNAYESMDDSRALFAYRGTVNAYTRQMERLNESMENILGSDLLSDEQKRVRYNNLRRERAQLSEKAIEIVAAVKRNRRLWNRISGGEN